MILLDVCFFNTLVLIARQIITTKPRCMWLIGLCTPTFDRNKKSFFCSFSSAHDASDWRSSHFYCHVLLTPAGQLHYPSLHCHVNAALSAQKDKYAGDNVGVDMHSIYASIIAFDDVDNYVALRRVLTLQWREIATNLDAVFPDELHGVNNGSANVLNLELWSNTYLLVFLFSVVEMFTPALSEGSCVWASVWRWQVSRTVKIYIYVTKSYLFKTRTVKKFKFFSGTKLN